MSIKQLIQKGITHIINEKIIYCSKCGGHGHRMSVGEFQGRLACRYCGYTLERKDIKEDHLYEIICLNCNSKYFKPIKICEQCGIEFQI